MPVTVRNSIPPLLGILALLALATALFIRPAPLPAGVAKFAPTSAVVPVRRAAATLTYAYDSIFADGTQYPIGTTAPSVSRQQTIGIVGWVLDSRTMMPAKDLLVGLDTSASLRIVRDYHLSRPDVAVALHDPDAVKSGFHAYVTLNGVSPGPHRIRFAIVDAHGRTTALPATIQMTVR